MSDNVSNQEGKPLPEVAELIKHLSTLSTRLEYGSGAARTAEIEALRKTIKLLQDGEPFHPEPHPDSGQGKWRETAAMFSRNQEFYQGITTQIGEIIGPEARTSDDGSVQDSVLALKLPELVKGLKEYRNKKEAAEKEQRSDDPRLTGA